MTNQQRDTSHPSHTITHRAPPSSNSAGQPPVPRAPELPGPTPPGLAPRGPLPHRPGRSGLAAIRRRRRGRSLRRTGGCTDPSPETERRVEGVTVLPGNTLECKRRRNPLSSYREAPAVASTASTLRTVPSGRCPKRHAPKTVSLTDCAPIFLATNHRRVLWSIGHIQPAEAAPPVCHRDNGRTTHGPTPHRACRRG